ncbi:hypothetical protein OAT16_03405 [Prolixibacteraceae bacterium]|nr:hypothetical protein [Prolixibacteraceae bacterium]
MDRELITEKKRIHDCFKQGFQTYDQHACIQKLVANKLVAHLSKSPMFITTLLEIGAGSGILTESFLCKHMVGEYRINDIVTQCYSRLSEITRFHNVPVTTNCMGDVEQITLPLQNSVILSSSVFQWIHNLPLLIERLAATQKSKDIFAFSLYTRGTYQEFQQTTGTGLPYHTGEEVSEMVAPYYDIIDYSTEKHTLFFDRPRDVLLHMKQTGVNGVGITWSKSQHLNFLKNYPAVSDQYQLTYTPSYYILKRK